MNNRGIGNTYVVLIGSTHTNDSSIPPILNISANLTQLKEVLSDREISEIPIRNFTEIVDKTKQEVLIQIDDLFDQLGFDDFLIVYYAGHGSLSAKNLHLYLTCLDSRTDKIEFTWLKAEDLAEAVKDSRPERKVLIIDSCYSGAILSVMSAGIDSNIVSEINKNKYEGIYTLVSASENQQARFDANNPDIPTYFTQELINVLKEGVSVKEAYISTEILYKEIRARLNSKNLPRPIKKVSQDGNEFIISKNKKFVDRTPDILLTPQELEELIQMKLKEEKERVISFSESRDKIEESLGVEIEPAGAPDTFNASQRQTIQVENTNSEPIKPFQRPKVQFWTITIISLFTLVAALLVWSPYSATNKNEKTVDSSNLLSKGKISTVDSNKKNQATSDSLNISIINYTMVTVEGGQFQMGGERETPVHEVNLQPYRIGKYEVNQSQWKLIMSDNPSRFKNDSSPVENVSWYDVQKFIKKLNERTGKKYRFPTEAEWEYAAAGGTGMSKYLYSGSNKLSEVGWYVGNCSNKTHPVGLKMPNGLGIYDMTGNVWEWCQDWMGFDYYKTSPKSDPQGPDAGDVKVIRGGSIRYDGHSCYNVRRWYQIPRIGSSEVGFRLAEDA